MGCEKDIQVLHKTGIFKHLYNSRRFLASFMFDYIFYSFIIFFSLFFVKFVFAFFDSFANIACVRINTLVLLIKIFN